MQSTITADWRLETKTICTSIPSRRSKFKGIGQLTAKQSTRQKHTVVHQVHNRCSQSEAVYRRERKIDGKPVGFCWRMPPPARPHVRTHAQPDGQVENIIPPPPICPCVCLSVCIVVWHFLGVDYYSFLPLCLQCSDTVGWASREASGL